MPYQPPNRRKETKGGLVGFHDGQPISRRYEMTVSNNRERLLKEETPAERAFRELVEPLVAKYNLDLKRQRVFHITEGVAFIVDFYFNKFRVAVEIDGRSHRSKKEQERDAWRDRVIKEKANVQTIRFSNEAVLRHPDDVQERLIDALLNADNATPSRQRLFRRQIESLRGSTSTRLSEFDSALDRNL